MLVEALELPTEERAALAEELLASLHEPDPRVDQAWAKLIDRRAKDILDDGATGPECAPFLLDLAERLKRGQ